MWKIKHKNDKTYFLNLVAVHFIVIIVRVIVGFGFNEMAVELVFGRIIHLGLAIGERVFREHWHLL